MVMAQAGEMGHAFLARDEEISVSDPRDDWSCMHSAGNRVGGSAGVSTLAEVWRRSGGGLVEAGHSVERAGRS